MFASPHDDVTAVVLSIGEATTDEAVASLRRQTLQPRDTIIVRDVVPFHKALNMGASQVKTPFFVQVDADMILDRECIATLRRTIRRDVGIVVARLRDCLSGQVVGVKLFRTACFDTFRFRDTISPDTDFVNDIAQAGWKTIYVSTPKSAVTDRWPTLGEHRRDYTADYTYSKFLAEGCRYRYRDAAGGFRGHLLCLTRSSHPSALIAQIGLLRGIFLEPDRDLLGRPHHEAEMQSVRSFLNSTQEEVRSDSGLELSPDALADERFWYFYRLGFGLFREKRIAAFRSLMSSLGESADPDAWISKVAICKGLWEQDVEERRIAKDYAILRSFVPHLPIAARHIDTTFEAIAAYAAEIGLENFVIAGPQSAEYQITRTLSEPKYRQTKRTVRTSLQSGRPRITAPRRHFGNVICTEPEHIQSLYWCIDLLRAGYLFVHIPTAMGPRRIALFRQVMANVRGRFRRQQIAIAPPREAGRKAHAALDRLARLRGPKFSPKPGCVLMVVGDLGCGGSERQTLALSSGLVKRGYQVRLIVLNSTRPWQLNFEQEFLRIGIMPQQALEFDVCAEAGFKPIANAHLGADLSNLIPPFSVVVIQLIEAIRNHRPQIVHGWLDSPGLAAALAATSLGTPRIVVQYGSMSLQQTGQYRHLHDYFRRGFRAIARNPTVTLVANCTKGAADYARWLDLPAGHVRVIPNGLMNETVRMPSKEELSAYRARLKLPSDVPVVGTVMRFAEEKDPWLWLAAAAEIAKASPRTWFVLAGYGELLEGCRERAQALGLHRIVFPGPVNDVGLIYALLDVFLLTSKVEGLPNVLIEAQAAGCPVVTTDVGGAAEALIDGVTGRVVGERSSESIARAVLDVLHPTWRQRVRMEARDFIASRFGFEKMVNEMLGAYRTPFVACSPIKSNS